MISSHIYASAVKTQLRTKPAALPKDGGRSAPSVPPKGKKAQKDSPALSPQRAAQTELPAKRRAEKSKRQEALRETVSCFAPLAMETEETISSIWADSSIPSSPRASTSSMECSLSPSKPNPPRGETPRSSAFLTVSLPLHPRGPWDGEGEATQENKSGKGWQCIRPFIAKKPELGLQIATSLQSNPRGSMKVVWKYDNFSLEETVEKTFNVSVPMKTRKNGTLYVHAFLYPRGKSVDYFIGHSVSKITTYALPQASYINLLGSDDSKKNMSATKETSTAAKEKTHSHWRPKLSVAVLSDDVALDRHKIPGEIYEHLRMSHDGNYYYPIVLIDELGFRLKDLLPLNESSSEMPLTIAYSSISLGKLRLRLNIQKSFITIKSLGFTDKDTDEIKSIFSDTNLYFLLLTFTVAAFHLLFDFLAFKNDISYWKKRKNMVGLSSRVGMSSA
ncbi:cleft lip and palate transmembrane protein 1-like protein [Plakobranchus ocellatus]|uniref:Lipid scramblase CLPTM1L n=1 Tax=Plakobranchus ocellatus TaxID=259542 RepID=A0AAV4CIT8_9GAST|nr:cleft lip and palate transmembrane protein 1-like protein [Plakobranchus ocellatus]